MGDFPHKSFDQWVTRSPDDDWVCDECGGVGGDHDFDCSEDD